MESAPKKYAMLLSKRVRNAGGAERWDAAKCAVSRRGRSPGYRTVCSIPAWAFRMIWHNLRYPAVGVVRCAQVAFHLRWYTHVVCNPIAFASRPRRSDGRGWEAGRRVASLVQDFPGDELATVSLGGRGPGAEIESRARWRGVGGWGYWSLRVGGKCGVSVGDGAGGGSGIDQGTARDSLGAHGRLGAGRRRQAHKFSVKKRGQGWAVVADGGRGRRGVLGLRGVGMHANMRGRGGRVVCVANTCCADNSIGAVSIVPTAPLGL